MFYRQKGSRILCKYLGKISPLPLFHIYDGLLLFFKIFIHFSHTFGVSWFQIAQFQKSPGDFPFVIWRLTLFTHHLLNWFKTNFFAFRLIVKSNGCSLFVKLWGSNLQLFSKQKDLISFLSWTLKVSIMISENCFRGYPSLIFFARRYGNIFFFK